MFSGIVLIIDQSNNIKPYLILDYHDKQVIPKVLANLSPVHVISALNEWYNTDPTTRYKVSENLCIPEVEDYAKEVIDVNYKLFREYNLTFTPTFFINGYLLPNQYDIEDIKYFNEYFGINNEILISRNLS